ncbi:hypothetical protein RRG08_053980, partial [Elysia crispata]
KDGAKSFKDPAGYSKDGSMKAPAEEAPIHRIRITLTSLVVKSLEKETYPGLSFCIQDFLCPAEASFRLSPLPFIQAP